MDNATWQKYTKELTGDYGREYDCHPKDPNNHVGMTVQFFKSLNIDHPGKRFLDLGCHDGETEGFVKARWNGIDLMPSKNKKVVTGDMHVLPYKDCAYDVVFCSHTLEHVLSPIICLAEMSRVLKDDGSLIVGVPIYPHFQGDDHNYVLTNGSWIHLFKRAGFVLVEASGVARGCMSFHLKKRPRKEKHAP